MNLDLNTPTIILEKRPKSNEPSISKQPNPSSTAVVLPKPKKVKLAIDREAMKRIKLVAVAYSNIEREWFPTEELTMPSRKWKSGH